MTSSNIFDVAIAGAGPAGTSMAIQLAMKGARVILVEEKKFPRSKLCGEFISPECLTHFRRLGVLDQMMDVGGASLSETVFYSRRGHSVAVPSEWFKSGTKALGLSRSEMDHKLLERAKGAGVTVLEEARASLLVQDHGQVCGLRVKTREGLGDTVKDYPALITIDATGRIRALAREVDRQVDRHVNNRGTRKTMRPSLVAFKAHLQNARVADGACEIYFYPGGYGGLTGVEDRLSNLCFIVSAEDVRRYDSDPESVMNKIVRQNARADYTLAEAHVQTPWLSVSLDSFGRRKLAPASGLLSVGDAAAFIDPFTGSGMLMALENGQIAADIISRHLVTLGEKQTFESLASEYRAEYSRGFNQRLRIAGMLRRAAFVPRLAEAAIFVFGTSSLLRRRLAHATRHSSTHKNKKFPELIVPNNR